MQLPLLFLQPCLPDGGTGDAGTFELAWSKLDSKVLALRVLSYRTKLPLGGKKHPSVETPCLVTSAVTLDA